MTIIKILFGLQERVSQKTYLLWGILLMALKYFGEASLYYQAEGSLLPPLHFLSPLLHLRYPNYAHLPDWFIPSIVIWSLPFIWIGVGMSIRRAMDANLSPWLGILFFIPGINYLLILALSIAPTKDSSHERTHQRKVSSAKITSLFALTIVFALLGTLCAWFNTNFIKTYAISLFVGSPLILGLVQGYLLNVKNVLGVKKTAGFVFLTLLFIHLLLLLFALEGIICLVMSLPLSFCLGMMGAIFGSRIAAYQRPSAFSPTLMLLALPLMPLIETQTSQLHQDVVLSSIEIDAPPEKVWPNVVKFSDLPPSTDWLFQLGIAYPLRARIEGQGVGAVRHCEFSSGVFVEPITLWDEPDQLAFNVRYQPQPMKELSFYDHVDAPHLNGYFRSVKGEFRLIRISNNKTRLEGRTWYEMDMQPGWYWQIFGRYFIHKIHLRVLSHIKNLSENNISFEIKKKIG